MARELKTTQDGYGKILKVGDRVVSIDYYRNIDVFNIDGISFDGMGNTMIEHKDEFGNFVGIINTAVYKFDTKYGYISGYKASNTSKEPTFTNDRKDVLDAYAAFGSWSADMYGQGGEKVFKAFDKDGKVFYEDLSESVRWKTMKKTFNEAKRTINEDWDWNGDLPKIADYILDRFAGEKFISYDDFSDAFKDGYKEICKKEIVDYDIPIMIDGKERDVFDVETDLRIILSLQGWGTIFEGNEEGGLRLEESCRAMKESRRMLKEEVSNEAYKVAAKLSNVFNSISTVYKNRGIESDLITRDEFDEQFAIAIREVFGVDNVWEYVDENDYKLPNGVDLQDFETDVRGILIAYGWSTIFEGDEEGGLEKAGSRRMSKEAIIYQALKEYENRHYQDKDESWQEVINNLIDEYSDYDGELEEGCKSKKKGKKLKESVTVTLDEDYLLDMLMNRLHDFAHLEPTDIEYKLYEEMYQSYIDSGAFEGMKEFDPMVIVDNDWVNYCEVVGPGDDEHNYNELVKIYNEQGLGDVSTEDVGFSYIEAAREENGKLYFLCRW